MNHSKGRLLISDSWRLLEQALIRELEQDKAPDPLQPAVVLVGSRLLARHLEFALYPALNRKGLGINIRFLVFPDLAEALSLTPPYPELQGRAGHLLQLAVAGDVLAGIPEHDYFNKIKTSPGLPKIILSEYRDLKDGLVTGPRREKVKQALGSGRSQKLPSLFSIFSELDRRFQDLGMDFDEFADALERAEQFEKVFGARSILVYGFYDFTAIQKQMLRALAQTAAIRAFMVQPEKNRFFSAYSEDVFDFYGRELGLKAEAQNSGPEPADLSRLQKSLSVNQRADLKEDRTVSVIFAPGIDREVLEICRELMRLIGREGLRFDEIGVLLRDHGYLRALEESFKIYGIPYYLASGKPLVDFSSIRALLNLLRIAAEGYARPAVISFLSGHCLKPDGLHAFSPSLAGMFDIVSREALVVKGAEEWPTRLAGYLENLKKAAPQVESHGPEHDRDDDAADRRKQALERKISVAAKLMEITEVLFADLESLRGKKKYRDFADACRELCDKYIDLDFDREDQLREGLEAVLAEIRELDQVGVAADFAAFCRMVQDGLARGTVRKGTFRQGGVCVSELMAARGARFRAVIIPGLCEGSFPLKIGENPLMADDDRDWINRTAGAPAYLAIKQKLAREERLLFYLACCQADEFLVLTAPWLDLSDNREKPASYLLYHALKQILPFPVEYDKLSRLKGKRDFIRWVDLSDLIPPAKEYAVSPQDYEQMRLEQERDPAERAYLLKDPSIKRLLELASERWIGTELGPFTGLIGGEFFQTHSRSVIPESYSPHRLRSWFNCPFSYLMARILEVEKLEEPARKWDFEKQELGSLFHRVLENLFTQLKTAADLKDERKYLETLAEIIEKHGREYLLEQSPATGLMVDLELGEAQARLAHWQRFLLPGSEINRWETEVKIDSRRARLDLDDGSEVALAGYMDRVETSEQQVETTDYKLGDWEGLKKDWLKHIQLPLYLVSVANIYQGVDPSRIRSKFLVMSSAGIKNPEVLSVSGEFLAELKQALAGVIKYMRESMGRGFFSPVKVGESHNNCAWCDYASACFGATASFDRKRRNDLIKKHIGLLKQDSPDFKVEKDGKKAKR